jgi:hypothetical protein
MSVYEIVNFINNTNKNEISYSNYFTGDINEFRRIGQMYITILKDNFDNHFDITDNTIIINHNDLWFHISFLFENYNIYWNISITKTK